MSKKILIVTGDAGEGYEAWYARHRFQEEGYVPVVAAQSKRRLHLVMHDFEPGWDTYIERTGYGMEADIAIDKVKGGDYAAVLIIGGRNLQPEAGCPRRSLRHGADLGIAPGLLPGDLRLPEGRRLTRLMHERRGVRTGSTGTARVKGSHGSRSVGQVRLNSVYPTSTVSATPTLRPTPSPLQW
jgi:hypothetical protein